MFQIGDRFTRLTVVARAEPRIAISGRKYHRWLCRCDCGNEKVVAEANLRSGTVRSCSCLQQEHAMRGDSHRKHLKSLTLEILDADSCIEWCGACNRAGYGVRLIPGTGHYITIHRLAWGQVFGPIPADMHVLHRCDNPACYNPRHLFIGTHKDNMQDMVLKDRCRPKISFANRVAIVRRLRMGERGKDLAVEFGVTRSNISRIKRSNICR